MPDDAILLVPVVIRIGDAECERCQIPFMYGEGHIGEEDAICGPCLDQD